MRAREHAWDIIRAIEACLDAHQFSFAPIACEVQGKRLTGSLLDKERRGDDPFRIQC